MSLCSCVVQALRKASADSRQCLFPESNASMSYQSVLRCAIPSALAALTVFVASAMPCLRAGRYMLRVPGRGLIVSSLPYRG